MQGFTKDFTLAGKTTDWKSSSLGGFPQRLSDEIQALCDWRVLDPRFLRVELSRGVQRTMPEELISLRRTEQLSRLKMIFRRRLQLIIPSI